MPFPLSESQAAVIAAVWANALPLPPLDVMKKWEEELYRQQGEALHVLGPQADGEMINHLHGWALQASPRGKEPPYWDDELMWRRSIYAIAKLEFEKTGGTAKTLEELGYKYSGPGWKQKEDIDRLQEKTAA